MRNMVTSFLGYYISFLLAGLSASLLLACHRLFQEYREKRWRHFTALYEMPVQRIMERVGAGEAPAFHSYHTAHRPYIYQLMLSYAADKKRDFHAAFDYLGFTGDLLSGEIKRSQEEILADLAVIRSPLSKDALYMLLLEGDEESIAQAAHALTRIELEPGDQEIILPTLVNLPLPQERILELVKQLQPSKELCRQLLEEKHSEQSVALLSCFLASPVEISGLRLAAPAPTCSERTNKTMRTSVLELARHAQSLHPKPSPVPMDQGIFPDRAVG